MGLSLLGFLLFVVLGCAVGFLAGLFGIGGGVVMVPLLVFTYGHLGVSPNVLTHIAIATSLLAIFFASLSSAYQHGKQRTIDWHAALVLGLSSAVVAFGMAKVATHLSGQSLRIAFALIALIVAVRMFIEKGVKEEKAVDSPPMKILPFILIGVTAGLVSSLAGVGGGAVTIPMMYYILKMPIKRTIGTSSATIVITVLFSVSGYILHGIGRPDLPPWCLGFVDLPRGAALAIGSLLTARVGAYVSFRTHPYALRKLYALFLFAMSVYLLFLER